MSVSGGIQTVDTSGLVGEGIIAADSGNGANTPVTATLAAAAGKFTYLTGYDIDSDGATTAAVMSLLLSGVPNLANFPYYAFAQPLATSAFRTVRFPQPLRASAVNTAISLFVPALGVGNTRTRCWLYGYQA